MRKHNTLGSICTLLVPKALPDLLNVWNILCFSVEVTCCQAFSILHFFPFIFKNLIEHFCVSLLDKKYSILHQNISRFLLKIHIFSSISYERTECLQVNTTSSQYKHTKDKLPVRSVG